MNIDPKIIQSTKDFIVGTYDDFIQQHKNKDMYAVDEAVVTEISERYHLDETRIRSARPDKSELGGHEKAGYICYWVSALRPIVVRNFDVYKHDAQSSLYINELFAVQLGFGHINSMRTSTVGKVGSDILTRGFLSLLLHTLRFSVTTGDNLSMFFYLVNELIPLERTAVDLDGYSKLNAQGKEKLKERLMELLRLQEHTAP